MAAKRERVLLAEITVAKKGTRQYARWDTEWSAGNHIDFYDSDYRAEVDDYDTDWHNVRATQSVTSGLIYWETYHVFSSSPANFTAGIAITTHPTNTTKIGSSSDADKKSVAGPDKDGDIYCNGTMTYNGAPPTSPFVVRHLYNADNGDYQIAVNGGSFVDADGDNPINAYIFYPAASLKGDPGFGIGATSVYLRSNPGLFSYAVPEGAKGGVYYDDIEYVTLYLSSDSLQTLSTDTPANTEYLCRIAAGTDVEIEREGSCWVQGGQTRGSRGKLTLVLNDGEKDAWIDYAWRDARVVLYKGYKGDARSDFTVWSTCLVESDDFNDNVVVLTLTDNLSKLDKALQTELFSNETQNTQIQHKVVPICLGKPRFVEGSLLSTLITGLTAFTNQIAEDAVYEITTVYDRGDPFEYPIDWQYFDNREGFKLTNRPVGKIVCDPNGQMVKIATLVDDTNGGDFNIWVAGTSNDDPDGWIVYGESHGLSVYPDGTRCVIDASAGGDVHIGKDGLTLTPDSYYLYTFDLISLDAGGELYIGVDGAYTTYSNTPGSFAGIFQANIFGTEFTIGCTDIAATIDNVRLYEVQTTQYLSQWIRFLLMDKGGLAYSDIDWDSVDALRAKADYELAGFFNSPVNILTTLRKTLDSWCGWAFTKRDGTVAVDRFELPVPSESVLTITEAMLLDTPHRYRDLAQGLTTRMRGARNYTVHADSDLVTTVSPELKAQMQAEFLVVKAADPASYQPSYSSNIALVNAQVEQAVAAEPLDTYMALDYQVQAEISRVATTWRDTADLWDVPLILDESTADILEPGQTVKFVYPRYGLDAGKYMKIKKVKNSFFSNVVILTLWTPET